MEIAVPEQPDEFWEDYTRKVMAKLPQRRPFLSPVRPLRLALSPVLILIVLIGAFLLYRHREQPVDEDWLSALSTDGVYALLEDPSLDREISGSLADPDKWSEAYWILTADLDVESVVEMLTLEETELFIEKLEEMVGKGGGGDV